MKAMIKSLGVFYISIGGLMLAFSLLILLLQILESLGITKSYGKSPGFFGALSLLVLLGSISSWFIQIGMGLMQFKYSAWMSALIMGSILLLMLNVILMLLKDKPGVVGIGWTIFHSVMIAAGVFTLILLLPKSARQLFT